MIGKPMEVNMDPAQAGDGPHPALLQLAQVIEAQIRAFPDQWLLLQKA
jgi:lauroyl/myristoyl acyltransferase